MQKDDGRSVWALAGDVERAALFGSHLRGHSEEQGEEEESKE